MRPNNCSTYSTGRLVLFKCTNNFLQLKALALLGTIAPNRRTHNSHQICSDKYFVNPLEVVNKDTIANASKYAAIFSNESLLNAFKCGVTSKCVASALNRFAARSSPSLGP
jgi:hypothetical protein